MSILLNLFYGLPIEFIVQCFFLLSLGYLCFQRRFARCLWFRPGLCIALAVWIAAVLWITVVSRSPGSESVAELIPLHSYRKLLAGGSPEIIRTNFMNTALFYPAGILAASLLPEHQPRCMRMLSVGISFALFSLAIEYVQFRWTLGQPEIDDVIHNTLGALCGTIPVVLKDLLQAPAQ